jgi:hypothetical protein
MSGTTRRCKYCQELCFPTLWGGKEYCSILCRQAANDALRKKETKQVRIKSRRCAECLHPFEPKPQQLYCGVACRQRSARRNRERRHLASLATRSCLTCDTLPKATPKPEKEEVAKNCVFCDREFTPGGRNRYYCSDECKSWDDDATGMERLKAEQEAETKTKARARSLSDLASGKVAAAPIRTAARKERRLPGL